MSLQKGLGKSKNSEDFENSFETLYTRYNNISLKREL